LNLGHAFPHPIEALPGAACGTPWSGGPPGFPGVNGEVLGARQQSVSEGMLNDRCLSVVIPTYERPTWLRQAVMSLVHQRPIPLEVIAVARASDEPTLAVISDLRAAGLPFPIVRGIVSEPGFMPPVFEGIRIALGDVVAFLDDDGEAMPGWTAGILRHYDDPRVGAVGGRCINVENGEVVPVPATGRVGYVSFLGRFVGNMWMTPTFAEPVPVDFMMGGCMSYRREVALALEPDMRLNMNVAFGFEVDLGLQVRNAGWKIVFDPAVAIRHHSAPRQVAGMRKAGSEQVYSVAYNGMRVAMRRLPFGRRGAAFCWNLLVGERRAPGILSRLLPPVSRRLGFDMTMEAAARAGRIDAVRELLNAHSRQS
jgi:GT2 family glycosyltransferase